MRSFGVVFVLFEPTADSLANLERALRDGGQAVVVDNTPRPNPSLHESLRGRGVYVIANGNSGGLAGAYNRGVSYLARQGCELCFMLDQDSDTEPGFLRRMTTSVATVQRDDFLLGPQVYEVAMDKFLHVDPDDTLSSLTEAEFVISSGSAVTASAFARLGNFAEDLFIEYVDVEYSFRAREAGLPILVNTGEILRQHTGAMSSHGRTFTTNHVAVRRYYLVRNGIWVTRRYKGRSASLLVGARLALRELVVILRYERNKVRKCLAVIVGASDGFRARLGTFEKLWPAVHRLVAP